MATQPTQNAVPSESPRDLKFNAGKIDEFVTSLVNTYVDRFGNEHYTIEGLRWLAQQAIAQYGWILIDSFQGGANITMPNQALRDEDTGEYYRWDGALPKHVDVGSTPDSSGGKGIGAWLSIGDAALRSMLASNEGAKEIGTSSGNNAQHELDSLHKSVNTIPSKFSVAYSENIVGNDYAQGLAETDNYWFIGYDNNHAGHVKRIRKSDLSSVDSGTITSSHLQGIAVIDDNTIMVGGNNEGEIIRYSFTTGVSTTITTPEFRKDYPFCWDGECIYQMQNIDPSISTAEFTYVALLKPGFGVVGRSEMFRKYIRQGYIQGMTIHNGELIFFTGGSFSGDKLANRNIATIYKTSLAGNLLDAKQFYKTSFIANFGASQSYESQGISCINNLVTLSCYVSGKLMLLKEDYSSSGKEVGTSYSLNEVFYYGMSEVGVTDSQLSTGGIQLIVNTMVDNSRLIQSVSSDSPNLQLIIGMPYGVLEIIKITNYRAICKFYYDSSDLASPKSAVSYVYDTFATPFYYHKLGRLTSPILYQSTAVAAAGTIPIAGILALNKLTIEITNTTATNPIVRDVYDTDDMNHLSSNSLTVLTTSGSSSIAYRLLSTGIQVTAVTGAPIIRFVTGS